MKSDRAWWEASPREGFTARAAEQQTAMINASSKQVRDAMRHIEEFWAMTEQRAVGIKHTMVYR
jgi:hypothetical protein